MSMNLSIFENDGGLGGDLDDVLFFSFYWNNVRVRWSNQTLRQQVLQFTEAFEAMFPRVGYNNPSVGYTDKIIFIADSQLRGMGETRGKTLAQLRSAIIALAERFDIVGEHLDFNINGQTYRQLEQGGYVDPDPYTVTPIFTTDGADKAIDDLKGMAKDAAASSISWTLVAGLAILVFVLRD